MEPRKYSFTLTRTTAVEPTPEVLTLANGFGIGTDKEHQMVFYEGLEIEFAPGRLIYIHGESGAGKTSLLRDIKAAAAADFAIVDTGDKFVGPEMPHGKPLISMFGLPTAEAAGILAMAGLSEPFVMLRKPEELSDGQRYRLGIAWSIHKARAGGTMLMLDEFLAVLDRNQAKTVAANLRRAVTNSGFCAVLASTHDDIVEDLNADTRIKLRLNRKPTVA